MALYSKYKRIKAQRTTGGKKIYLSHITNDLFYWNFKILINLLTILFSNYRNVGRPDVRLDKGNHSIPQI